MPRLRKKSKADFIIGTPVRAENRKRQGEARLFGMPRRGDNGKHRAKEAGGKIAARLKFTACFGEILFGRFSGRAFVQGAGLGKIYLLYGVPIFAIRIAFLGLFAVCLGSLGNRMSASVF